MQPGSIDKRKDRRRIRVLVVDDSAIVRKILSDALQKHEDLEVVGTAPDPYIAREKIIALAPDVLTLDLEMPRMDGLTFLKKLMHYHPMPVIVISSLGQASCAQAVEALRLGAVEVLGKPSGPYSVGELQTTLAAKVHAAGSARLRGKWLRDKNADAVVSAPASPVPALRTIDQSVLIAIGASTGGTEAIEQVLLGMPEDCPPIVITQHIPAGFSLAFANRLNKSCRIHVKEAVDGDLTAPGRALLAPGSFHMVVKRQGTGYRVQVQDGPMVCYQKPSVDVMFASVAEAAKANAIGVLLTGMGADGARGLLKMHNAGAWTLAQNEATCVVFGMPREAVKVGAVDTVAALHDVARLILAGRPRRVA